jgi:hypothetical protein
MTTNTITRGATVQWATTFYDVNSNVIQPDNATINILPSMTQIAIAIPMTPPAGQAVAWTALWDTRGIPPGQVYWSIHTGHSDPIPVVAEDGSLVLSANPANLVTF